MRLVEGMMRCSAVLWPLWGIGVAAVVMGSLLPASRPPGPEGMDKVLHLVAYGGLTALPVALAIGRRAAILAPGGMLVLGGILEILQGALPVGRSGSLADMVANAMGVAMGMAAGRLLRARG